MLTQAFQCFAKEADGARSPFFVHRPPKVKSSNAAPRSAATQRSKTVKSSARWKPGAPSSPHSQGRGQAAKRQTDSAGTVQQVLGRVPRRS